MWGEVGSLGRGWLGKDDRRVDVRTHIGRAWDVGWDSWGVAWGSRAYRLRSMYWG